MSIAAKVVVATAMAVVAVFCFTAPKPDEQWVWRQSCPAARLF